MQFHYTATNPEGKSLNGIINADNDEHARKQLNELGFSILELSATTQTPETSQTLAKFEFEALDKTGKKIVGRIGANTPLLAYKRLIEEYGFQVQYLASEQSPPDEKQNMRSAGLEELKHQYEIQTGKTGHTEVIDTLTQSPEFLAEKNELTQQVDGIIQETKRIIAAFESKLSGEKRAALEVQMNKLLRIKSSNNLEYIRHTAQKLLKSLQNENIFSTQNDHAEDRKKILLGTQKLAFSLNKSGTSSKSSSGKLITTLHEWEAKTKGSKWNLLSEWMEGVEEHFKKNPQLEEIKTQLKQIKKQRWEALMLTIKAPKETRRDNWGNVKTIWKQEQSLKQNHRDIQKTIRGQQKLIQGEKQTVLIEEMNAFTGWLLGFYLIYYFLGHYITQHELNWKPFLGIPFDLKDSAVFKYLLVIVFLIHAAASLKINFWIKNQWATGIIFTSAAFLIILSLFNF